MTRLPTMTNNSTLTIALAVATACTALCTGAQANPITGALGETKPIIDIRARYEWVDQDPPPALLTHNANATTIRARLGAETGKAWNTALLVEGEFLTVAQDDYRSDTSVPSFSVPGPANYPVVADPEAYEVNRFQLTNTSIANTTITLGRQRINLDDQRFVGNVGWRMNEQTYDALRVINKPFAGNLTLDFTYSNRANRVFGPDSPQGAYKGDFYLGNVAYQFRVGKLTGFAYLLDFDPMTNFITGAGLNATQAAGLNPARVSSKTLGGRFAGTYNISKIKLAYFASYANQQDYGSYKTSRSVVSQQQFNNDYYAGELIGTYRLYSLGAGIETMEGDGVQGFQTPLATIHKFDGWADKFLSTPAKGLDHKYVTGGITTKAIKPFETVSLTAFYRKFDSTMGGLDLGKETDVQLTAKYSRFTALLKYADYHIGAPLQLIGVVGDTNAFSTLADTKKFWAQVDFLW